MGVGEVRPGYKRTEVGVVPEDWEVRSLADISECLIGLTYKPSDVRETGTLVLRSSNIQEGVLSFDDNVFVDMELPDRVLTHENDLLVCVRNGSRQLIGKCALIDKSAAGSAFGAFMAVLRCESPRLLIENFQSESLRRQIDETMGATINQITNRDMVSFFVPWPPRPEERQRISSYLQGSSELLSGFADVIAKKRDLKQAAMQELLRPKEDWVKVPLEVVCWPSKERFTPTMKQEKICVELEHIASETGRLLATTTTLTTVSQKAVFQPGDVLFGKLRPYLRKYWLATFEGVCSTEFWVLRSTPTISARMLYFLLQTNSIIEAANLATGTKMPRAEWKVFKTTEISYPRNTMEQTEITDALSDMDAEIAVLEARLAKFRDLKRGMMQNLLTGAIRLR